MVKTTRTVFVSKSSFLGDWQPVIEMFQEEGWIVTNTIPDNILPDLVCFTGGSDVSPYLYGEENTTSYCDPLRDEYEKELYEAFLSLSVPMVGICRGGQFLNVLNGGRMIQHTGPHSGDVGSYWDGVYKSVRVDHHQGMISGPGAERLGSLAGELFLEYGLYYPDTKCLCFQPHPEWGHQPTKELFFELVEEYLF